MKNYLPLAVMLLLSACAYAPTSVPTATVVVPVVILVEENPFQPQPDDANLTIDKVILNNTSLLERFDLNPFRVELILSGSLPSVCNQLRVKVDPPNLNFQIFVQVYSISNSKTPCDNVLQQFEADLLLGVYTQGRYTVWVNGANVGDLIMY